MIRREVIRRLLGTLYIPEIFGSMESLFHSRDDRFTVKVRHGGSVCIWYKKHPIHHIWDGQQFWDYKETK